MLRAGTLLLFFVLVSIVSAGHKPMELHKMRFGTFLRSAPAPESEMAWTEITFFGGSVFSFKNQDSTCEDTYGHGKFEQKGDTLILSQINSQTTLRCTSEALENLVIPEKRYLVKALSRTSFQLLSLAKGHKRPAQWTTLYRFGRRH